MEPSIPRNLLSQWDVLALVAYLLVVTWVGLRASRSRASPRDYFVARRKLPGWAVGISMFASVVSCYTFVAAPGWAYDKDWQIMLPALLTPFVVLVCAKLIIPVYRAVVRISVYEYLEQRFGYAARLYCSSALILLTPLGNGMILYIFCLALNSVTGWNIAALIIITGFITLAYTFYGGIEGVVLTEILQGFIFLGSGLVALVYLLFLAGSAGPEQLISTAWHADKFRLADWTPTLEQPTVYIFLFMSLFQVFTTYATGQPVVQRFLMTSSIREAIKSTLISVGLTFVITILFVLLGSLLWAFYKVYPDRLDAAIVKGDQVFPFFIGRELPPGLAGLVLAGLCSSAMSGLSGALNSTSACLVSDFYLRFAPVSSPRRQIFISKLVVAVMGLVSLAFAFIMTYWKSGMMELALNVSAILGSIVTGGGLAIFLLGLFTRRASPRGLYWGLAAGILFALWANATHAGWFAFLPSYLKFAWHVWLLPGLCNILVFAVSYVVSRLSTPAFLAPEELTVFHYLRRRNQPIQPEARDGILVRPVEPIEIRNRSGG